MIVCVCNNGSDHKIRKAVQDGMETLAQIRQHLDVGTCSGKCHSCARQVIRDCLAQQRVSLFDMMQTTA